MHTGEEWFQFGWQQYLALGILIATYIILAVANRLPSMSAFKEFTDTINTAGGHIIVLLVMVMFATKITFQLFYHVLGLPADATVSAREQLINMMFTFCTTTLIMLPLGALIKGMTGGKAVNGNETPPPVPELPATPPAAAPPAEGGT